MANPSLAQDVGLGHQLLNLVHRLPSVFLGRSIDSDDSMQVFNDLAIRQGCYHTFQEVATSLRRSSECICFKRQKHQSHRRGQDQLQIIQDLRKAAGIRSSLFQLHQSCKIRRQFLSSLLMNAKSGVVGSQISQPHES